MSTAYLAAWLATMTVISLTPGAGAVASMSSGAALGLRRGIWTAVGQQLALLFLLVIAAIGLASLLHSLPGVFLALHWVGGTYLAYVGLRLIVASFREDQHGGPRRAAIPSTIGGMLRRGFLVNATNPKALIALFVITPRFLDPSLPLAPQYAILAFSMIAIDLIVMTGYTALGASFLRQMAIPAFRRRLDRIFGCLFLTAAVLVIRT